MTRWDQNPIVLCHCQRFFAAVTAVIERWEDPSQLGTRTALLGNVIWARSGFVAGSKEGEAAMALIGAVAGTLAGNLSEGSRHEEQALALVAAQERQLLERHDAILDGLLARFQGREPSPAEVNREFWDRPFRLYPYTLGTAALQAAIRVRLGSALGARS